MPIKGLSEKVRLPRLGKIRLGIKVPNASGKGTHPVATDYFVVPDELKAILGERPKELPIMFPSEHIDYWLHEYYKNYSNERGLRCRGDGETSSQLVDTESGEIVGKDTKDDSKVAWTENLPCAGKGCLYYQQKKCAEVMNLQFLMPTVPGLGVWQIDSGSINSILNINSSIALIKSIFVTKDYPEGRISGIPLMLTIKPQEVINPEDHKKKTVHVLSVETKRSARDLLAISQRPMLASGTSETPGEEEAPEDLFTEEYPVEDGDNQGSVDDRQPARRRTVKAGQTTAPEVTPELKGESDSGKPIVEKASSGPVVKTEPEKEKSPSSEDRAAMQKKVDEADKRADPAIPARKATVEQLKRLKYLRDNYTTSISQLIRKIGYDITHMEEKSEGETAQAISEIEKYLKQKGVL